MVRSFFLCALFFSGCAGRLVTFSNLLPRRDKSGAIMNAHDGTIRRYGPPGSHFYYHAMGYPACAEPGTINGCNSCLYNQTNSIDVWRSPDLSSGSWEHVSTAYPSSSAGLPRCTYFRSQAIFNPSTKEYVLWANAVGCVATTCPGGTCGLYAIATASSPDGPFQFITMATPAAPAPTTALGDFALFVDHDGSGWIVLTYLPNGAGPRDMYVFSLTHNFLGFGPANTGVLPGPKLVEAPSFFRRAATYYILLGGCTCMGLYGGGVGVLTAPHPLGPWENVTGSLDPGCPMMKQSTCFQMGPGDICDPVTQAQQNFVIEVPLADGTTQLVWTGDRWQQSPDRMYDQQPQTWLPLMFDQSDTILPLKWVDNFTLDVA